jgi:hypothetical protein
VLGNCDQLKTQAYFYVDPVNSNAGYLVFDRMVTVRDTGTKIEQKAQRSK